MINNTTAEVTEITYPKAIAEITMPVAHITETTIYVATPEDSAQEYPVNPY